jgi:hypothetical protein
MGVLTLFGEGKVDLLGASFKFSDFEDSPFVGRGSMDNAVERIEAEFPDGRMLVFARMYDF